MRQTLISVVASAALITGCASSVSSFSDVKDSGAEAIENAQKYTFTENELPHIKYSDDFFVPQVKLQDADKPAWYFQASKQASYLDYTLAEVMRDEFAQRGINIRYVDELDPSLRFSLKHSGTLGELLEKISFATKYSYTIKGDLLTWSKYETAEFDIAFIAGQSGYLFGEKDGQSGNVGTNQGGIGGAGGANGVVVGDAYSSSDEYISFSTKDLSLWTDLKNTLDILKSEEGRYVINEATTTVVVKDYPDNVKAIRDYLKRGNDRLTKMVAVDMEVIEYTSNEGDQRGVNWNVVKQDLATGGVFGLQTAFDSLFESNLAPTVLGYSQETGKYSGSQVLINILDKYGAVSATSNHRIVGLNNQVSKVDSGGVFGFLAQSGGTSTANVGSQDNLTPGSLHTGNTIFMLPNAVDDKIVIQLSTKFNKLENLRTVTSGDRRIETPETSKNELFVKFAIEDGQTLIINGSSEHRQEYTENTTAGVLALGGEVGGSKSSKETLLLITPRIIYQ